MIDEELRAGADDHEPACCDDVEEREGPRGAAGPSFWSNHPPRSSLDPSPPCHCYCQRQEDLSFRPTKLLTVASAFSALARTYFELCACTRRTSPLSGAGDCAGAGAANAVALPPSATTITTDAAEMDRIASSLLMVMPLNTMLIFRPDKDLMPGADLAVRQRVSAGR